MSNSVNKVILVGNLGDDPETSEVKSGPMTKLRIATNRSFKDGDGNKQERTEWHRLTCFGQSATFAGKYLTKGRKVYVEGRLETSKYADPGGGKDRFSTEVIVEEIKALDANPNGN